jgi:hypothetical protein
MAGTKGKKSAKKKSSAKSEKNKAKDTGNWKHSLVTYFLGRPSPWEEKYAIEKTTGVLLVRDSDQTDRLVFKGSSPPPDSGHELQLRFEAALPTGSLYSLEDAAWTPRSWFTEDEFLTDVQDTFQYWTRDLQGAPALGSMEGASETLYEERVRETLARESEEGGRKEDATAIHTVQQAVLAALRKGKTLGNTHHEGGTRLYFNGKKFVKEIFGVEEALNEFGTDEEMVACLRSFYDWDSRQETYPHRPPELDVWKFIQHELEK